MDHSDLDRQIELLRRCETIKESEVKALCSKAREILVEESNVQRVDSPVTVRKEGRKAIVLLKGNESPSEQGGFVGNASLASRTESGNSIDFFPLKMAPKTAPNIDGPI